MGSEMCIRDRHGRVIKDLLSVERPATPAPPVASEPEDGKVFAIVKFFNDLRGYGFVTTDNSMRMSSFTRGF